MQMTSNQPYMLRAFYDWIVDNNLTPYIVVDANVPGTVVPQQHVKDGQIVLNISPGACANLVIGNVDMNFEARFGGVPMALNVPCRAVLAIYAKENGAGTVFAPEEHLEEELQATSAEESERAESEEREPEQTPPRPKGRPNLKVIK